MVVGSEEPDSLHSLCLHGFGCDLDVEDFRFTTSQSIRGPRSIRSSEELFEIAAQAFLLFPKLLFCARKADLTQAVRRQMNNE